MNFGSEETRIARIAEDLEEHAHHVKQEANQLHQAFDLAIIAIEALLKLPGDGIIVQGTSDHNNEWFLFFKDDSGIVQVVPTESRSFKHGSRISRSDTPGKVKVYHD